MISSSVVDYAHRQGLIVAVWKIGSVAASDTPASWVHMERAGVVSGGKRFLSSFVQPPLLLLLTDATNHPQDVFTSDLPLEAMQHWRQGAGAGAPPVPRL